MNTLFLHVRNNLRLILFVVVAIFILFVFDAAFKELVGRVTGEERYTHGPLVFLIALYLVWIKRFELGLSNNGAWYGVLIVLLSGITLMIGELSAI